MKSIVTSADMALMNRIFRYDSPEKLPIYYEYDGHAYRGVQEPCRVCREALDANMVRYTVCGRVDESLELRVEITEYGDFAATEFLAFFTNCGNAETKRLRNVRIVDGLIEGEDAALIHGNGDTCREDGYEWFRDAVDEKMTLTPVDGTSCNGAFPYFRIMAKNLGVNIAVGWPAAWIAEIEPATGGAHISIGQARFDMVLRPGETMRTPRVNFLAFAGDETRGMNLWRRWYFAHILPRENGKPLPPKYCLHTFNAGGHPEFTGITTENQISGIDDYLNAGLRPDIRWIDAGWYPCDYDWPKIGTWKPDTARLPNGLAPIGEKCDSEGIQLLLWFEPERVREGTELAIAHPEWLLRRTKADGTRDENSLLNLGDRACCDWVIDRVDSIIKEGHVRVYRQDFNFSPREHWIQNEAENRIGALENLHVQGYLRYWDALIARNPGLWVDSCASGGRRNDLETMRRAVPLHYTDVGYGNHPIKQKQHREMFEWIPYFRAHNMRWDNPDGSYGRENHAPDEFAYYAAMAPSLTDMTEHDAPKEAMALAIRMRKIWRKAAERMLDGDYYPLTECRKSNEDFYAMQFHNPDTGSGFFQILSNTCNRKRVFTAKLRAIDDGVYALTAGDGESRMVVDAKRLREGISFELPRRSSVIWFYEKA